VATFKRRIWHQTLAIAIVPVVLGGFLFSTLFGLLNEMSETARQEQQASEFCDLINQNIASAAYATLAVYRFWRTRKQEYREQYATEVATAMRRSLKHLRENRDNKFELEYLETNMELMNYMRNQSASLMQDLDNPQTQMIMFQRGRTLLNLAGKLHEKDQEALERVQKHLGHLERKLARNRQTARDLLIGGFAACVLGTLFLAVVVRRSIVGRVLSLRQYVDALMRRNAPPMPVGGTDEIAELEQSFLYMSNSIRAAVQREHATLQGAKVICAVKPDGTIITSNNDEFPVGTNIGEWAGNDFMQQLENAKFSATPVTLETGSLSWSCNWSHKERNFYCIAHDISDLKAREEELRRNQERIRVLMQSMPAALFVTDAQGKIVRVNKESCELLQAKEQQLLGKNIEEFGSFTAGSRVAARAMDGTEVWCEVSQVTLDDQKLIIAMNVTDKIKIEQMRDRLKAMIAHDIGAPLTAIQATLKSLERGRYGEIDEFGMGRAATALAETGRLTALFKDFLEIEKHNASEWSFNFEAVNISDVLKQSAEAVRTLAEKSNINIKVEAQNIAIKADRDKLIQVFVNLISNALKFAPKDSTIFLQTQTNESLGRLRVTVKDQGPGIPPDMIESIFQPFKQTNITDATVKGGSGLGLAICKSIVEDHKGTIRAGNSTAGGAEFTVELPLLQA
jgi:signal transduction histidine kinase